MLPNSAHIQEIEGEQLNKRNAHRNLDPVEPIYGTADALACLERLRPVSCATWFDVSPDVRAAGPAIVDPDIASLHPPKLRQRLLECCDV